MSIKVEIEEMCDAFAITVNGDRFYFNQEGDKTGLLDVFEALDLDIEVTYEEVY